LIHHIVQHNNEPLEYLLKYRNDVFRIRPETDDINHPAPFPESLVEPLIRLYSDKGDIVLDPFLGSGTTMKVARDLERNSVGIERNVEYCGVAKKRVGFSQETLDGSISYKFVVVN